MGKQEVISAAERLFGTRGYDITSMREIAEAVGIKAGSIYAHVESKQEILFTIVSRASEDFLEAARPLRDMDTPAEERLEEAMRRHLNLIANKLDAATVFFHEWRSLSATQRNIARDQRREYEDIFVGIIEDGVREGTLRTDNPSLAAIGVLSILNWSYHWFDPTGPYSADELAKHFAGLVFNGLRSGDTVKSAMPGDALDPCRGLVNATHRGGEA
jgi:TetR/AcrR family transcriptional regulator, cholesterol catabolism regulator